MKQTAILLPVDNRPITYLFPQAICQLANIDVLIPPRNLMGSLIAPTDVHALSLWLENTAPNVKAGAIFVSLDSLLYGGLIPARRGNETLPTILARAAEVVNLKNICGDRLKIYAQSSIMRISDNYDNTEEKPYWSKYGREIFHWSELLHLKEIGLLKSESELQAAESRIPSEIRSDYLSTRNRNFAANQKIIDYIISGALDYLIFSQDDSGKYGLNVSEKDKLIQLIKEKNISNVRAYAGADEVLMSLIARYLNDQRQKPAKISIHYSSPTGKNIASNYEGQTIGRSIECQADAQGLQTMNADTDSTTVDFTVIVHTGADFQGDHIWLPSLKDLRSVDTVSSAKKAIELIEKAQSPIVLCDVAYSNGSYPALIDLLLAHSHLFKKIWSYAGWNTTGNAIGCALSIGCACLHAQTVAGNINDHLHTNILFLRLMDDWAYQTQVRKKIQPDKLEGKTPESVLSQLMNGYALQVAKALDFKPNPVKYSLPWQRTFEVEIN